MNESFLCINCGKRVNSDALGSKHRNHCPYCLWSVHLDEVVPGDRASVCGGAMEPIGLGYKSEGGKKTGELCVVHKCVKCSKLAKNRIAGDDDVQEVLKVFKSSLEKSGDGDLLQKEDSHEIMTQLFGKPKAEEMLKEFETPS